MCINYLNKKSIYYLDFLLYNLDMYILDINKLAILGKIYLDKIYKIIVIMVKVNTTSFTK